MTRFILLLTFVSLSLTFLFSARASAQKAVAPKTNQAAPQKKRSLMWKVTGNNNTVYLLGSVHLATKAFYPMPPEVENAFAQSSVLAVEVDVNKVDPVQAAVFIQRSGMYLGDDTLWKHLSPEATKKLEKVAADNNLPVQTFAKLKPWVVALMISVIPLQKNGFDPALGIDKYFLDKAKDKKRVAEIETADWQLRLLSEQPEAAQIAFLTSAINQAAEIKSFGELLQSVWLQGEAEKLETAFAQMNAEAPDFHKKLLDERNPKMADFTENCLKKAERCFVVVGAGHLVGKKGVVQLLKDKGYQVEQVSVASVQ